MTYNPVGLVTGLTYSGSSAPSISYTYDAQRHITGITDGTGSSSYSYDPFGELTSTTSGAGQTVGYGYDADGDTTGITYPLPGTATWASTGTVSYGYDHGDKLTAVTDFTGKQIAISNNNDGLPATETLGTAGGTLSYTYDQGDAPSAIALANGSGATQQSFTYSDAPDGEITAEADTPASGQSPASYTYDAQGRLTSMVPGSGGTLGYSYDASGDLMTLPGGATGTYDQAGELTSSSLAGTAVSYAFDANGDRTSEQQGSTTLATGSWNGARELTAYTNDAATMNTASYDASGLRVSDTITPAGGTASSQQFVWDVLSSKLLMDSADAYIYGTQGAPVEQVNLSTGNADYLVGDVLGSVRGVVDTSGNLIAATSYDAWGNPQSAGGLTGYTPFGFAGGYTDPTGLIYLIHRYYDPQTGQFISVDPALSQTGEPYAYAGDDPVGEADPLGEWAISVPCGDCRWTESDFENLLYVFLTAAAIAIGGVRVYRERATMMTTPVTNQLRIPDIYWVRTGKWGWINELKVGKQYWCCRNPIEAAGDGDMLDFNMGFGAGPNNRNHILPVNEVTWWFGPNKSGTYAGQFAGGINLYQRLMTTYGFNIIEIAYVKGAPGWPRRQSKERKGRETREIESENGNDALTGLEDMFPCIMMCPFRLK